jgi:hypothetical protein
LDFVNADYEDISVLGGQKMDKIWISHLANDIEQRHGKEARERIFGDFNGLDNSRENISVWFNEFIRGLDELNDKEFLQQMMADRCPCGGDNVEDGNKIRELYNNSKTHSDFVKSLNDWFFSLHGVWADRISLHGNILYLSKRFSNNNQQGSCGKGCHCWLAMYTDENVSDIFCYCCTIGHTGRPFKVAFGNDIKMEFIESIICGGKECTMAVYLPEKE